MVGKVSQSDWGAGMWRSGLRERAPGNAAGELQDLLLGDDGLPFQRGGATRKSNAATGTGGVSWVIDAGLLAGRRTLWGTPSGLFTFDVDDATPLQLTYGSPPSYPNPVRAVVLDGAVYVEPDTTGKEVVWGGSRKSAYTTGTVTLATGDRVVTGSGTSWLANVEAGMLFGTGGDDAALIESVDSDTQLTLRRQWLGGALSGSAYEAVPLHVSSIANPSPVYYASVASRILRTNGPQRVDFSQINNNGAYGANDNHLFPYTTLGFGTLRDIALVFTTGGVWSIENLAYDLIDTLGNPQQRKELVNADLILWGRLGVAAWGGSLIVPCLDGVWLLDTLSAPQRVSRQIDDLYLSYVRAGHHPGQAEVFNNHYKVPILSSSGSWVDTLVCKIPQGFAWSRLAGADAQVNGFAERSSNPPVLLGASKLSSSRVLDCSSFFVPAGGVKNDSDGTGRQSVWESREFAPSDLPTTFRRVRVWYELTDAASDGPTVEFSYAKDSDAGWTPVANSLGTVQASGVQAGGVSDGTRYHQWPVNKTARGMRFRVRTVGPAAGFRLRAVELLVEGSGNE